MFNPPSNEEDFSFDDLIHQSDREIKRLGWTSEQGRAYLLKTYGKRSRLMLLDEELIGFLQYLKSLPTSDISDLSSVSTANRETQFFDKSSKQIDIEIERLNWTEEQESEYLLKTYGKRARFMLPDQELSEFLSYLKSLPISMRDRTSLSFDDLIKQSDIEIKRLGWTKEQGRDYLKQTYEKRSRLMLTDVELLEFLQYLKNQPTP